MNVSHLIGSFGGSLIFIGLTAFKPDEPPPPEEDPPKEDREEEAQRDYTKGCSFPPPESLSQDILSASAEFGVDADILAVTVYRESGCDPWALGSSGEIGLSQITPKVWVKILRRENILSREQELWDPRTNLRAASWILSTLIREEKNTFEVFRRYNGRGPKARKYAREQERSLSQIKDR
jgi:soluble lytic murein transglycosylase-like protein